MKTRQESFLISQITNNLSLLIIGDNEDINKKFHNYLDKMFKKVDYISSYNKIINFLNSNPVNIIFLDLNTKGIQPYNLMDEIRKIDHKQIIITHSNTVSVEILQKCIYHRTDHFIKEPLDDIKIKDAIIHCLDTVLINENKDFFKKIEPKTDYTPIAALKYLMENFLTDVELINNYKGVPIAKGVMLVDIINDQVTLRIKDLQKYIISNKKHTIISSNYLYDDIYAYLKEVDEEKNLATFHDLSYISSYIHHRKSVRIEPESSFKLSISVKGKHFDTKVINLSSDYCLVMTSELPENLEVNMNLNASINFDMPQQSYLHKTLGIKCLVEDIFPFKNHYKILLYLELNKENSDIIEKYIYKRSLEIIQEFKKKTQL